LGEWTCPDLSWPSWWCQSWWEWVWLCRTSVYACMYFMHSCGYIIIIMLFYACIHTWYSYWLYHVLVCLVQQKYSANWPRTKPEVLSTVIFCCCTPRQDIIKLYLDSYHCSCW
jgi:hypothetical protein